MGVIKGDLLAKSDKLSQVSATASGHYSAFLTNARITDDFGRVHLFFHGIWVSAFERRLELAERGEKRDPVTLKMVRDWFREYEEAGLLKTYEVGGRFWAEWTNWQRKPASKERFHRAPEPPWSVHEHSPACVRTATLYDGSARTRGSREADASQPRGSRAAAVGAAVGAPSPSAPSAPASKTEGGGARATAVVVAQVVPGMAPEVAAGYEHLAAIAKATGEDPTEVFHRLATDNGEYPAPHTNRLELLGKRLGPVLARLRDEFARRYPRAVPPMPGPPSRASPAAQARADGLEALIRGGLHGDLGQGVGGGDGATDRLLLGEGPGAWPDGGPGKDHAH
jgi:hypothetical protein